MGTMQSMEMTDEESYDAPTPIAMPTKAQYPYGLCLSLTNAEIEKLGIDPDEAVVGGVFHLEGLARITSVSCTEGPDGTCCRIEAQIEDMGVITSDADQAGDAPAPKPTMSRLYKS